MTVRHRGRLVVAELESRHLPATFLVTTPLDVVNPTDGKLSLREAITRANQNPGADTVLLPAGVFKIALDGANENDNATGDFDVKDSLTIRGAGPGRTIIDGQYKDRLFDLIGPIRVQFAGVTLRHGGGDLNGGAVQALNANVALASCVVTDNRAQAGGGINAEAGNVSVTGSTIQRNVAGTDGGGIRLGTGTLTVTGSSVRRNLAVSGSGGGLSAPTAALTKCVVSGNSAGSNGGGVFARTATLTNCTASGNTAINGGGILAGVTAKLTNSALSDNSALVGGGLFTDSVTMTGCTVSGNRADGGGGLFAGTSATVTNSVVSHNSAQGGGGISTPNLTLTGSTVSGNFASSNGGGVDADTAEVTNSTVSGNFASSNGGGVDADTAEVTNSTVSGNSALEDGGGIHGNHVALFNSTVSGNSALQNGGGLSASSATLVNSTVSGNSALGSGGGIIADTATVTNSTVGGNSAGDSGGGIAILSGATIVNATIAGNSAVSGGGGLFRHPLAGNPVSVQNTIIAHNLAGFVGAGPDADGTFASVGHNLIGDDTGSTGFTNGVNGDLVGSAAAPIDPKVGPLQNNGGPTQTMALLAGSPAIDHGDNNNLPPTDQRGFPRIKDGNGDGVAVADIGAFER
ncbi:MAG: hypothetical protein J2P46_08360 [Zavarzinella sp.]|nr:hypothetical protein [Zavarzinella sp.]